jgi:hypothetical protein
MEKLITFFMFILCGQCAFAMCQSGYSDPIYICNYKADPKMLVLDKYKGGWSEIIFENLTVVNNKKITKNEKSLKVTEKFNFYKRDEMKTENYKIERVCNDMPNTKKPLRFVRISYAEKSLCINQPESSIIYSGTK